MKKQDKDNEEYLIEKRELGELFDSSYDLTLNLWRGQKKEDRGSPILYPILKTFKLSNGKVRKKDIRTYMKGNELWIDHKSGGISLFDVFGVPNRRWDYFRLPIGLKLPHGLIITKDDFNSYHQATHYSVKANWDMPLTKFLMLLDNLAEQLIFEG